MKSRGKATSRKKVICHLISKETANANNRYRMLLFFRNPKNSAMLKSTKTSLFTLKREKNINGETNTKKRNTIGEGAIIQAGSVVVNDIDKFAIAGGHPAKVFASRDVEHYLKLKSEGLFH